MRPTLRTTKRTAAEIFDDRLTHHLGLTIWAMRLKAGGLRDRYDWGGTIDGRTGRVDNPSAIKFGHHLKEIYCCSNIVLVIGEWNLGRLANCFVRLRVD